MNQWLEYLKEFAAVLIVLAILIVVYELDQYYESLVTAQQRTEEIQRRLKEPKFTEK